MNDKVSTVFTEYGEYIPLSQRLPQFLEAFPMSDGYGTSIEAVDPLSLKPGLLALYKECIRCGRSFKSMGLPPIPSSQSLVFIAKLLKDEKVVNTASTHQMIIVEKDYENAETRAFQRLVARSGYPGDVLELDESGIVTDLSRPIDSTVPLEGAIDDDLEPFADGAAETEELRTTEVPTVEEAESDIPKGLQSQVDARCAVFDQQGKDYTRPTSMVEALDFMRDNQASNGASP